MKRPKKLPRGIFVRNGEYWIRYTDQHGKLHREKVGVFLEPAKVAVGKRRAEVRELKFLPDKIKQRSVLFGEIAKAYIVHAKQAKRDWRHDQARVEVLLKSLKDEPIGELTPGRLEDVLGELGEKNVWSPATHNRYRTVLSAIFRRAKKNRVVPSNPVRDTSHRRENNERVRYLAPEEEQRLMKVLRDKKWPDRVKEILVALNSGMRRSEQYRTAQVPDGGLKWEHINFRAGVIRLPRGKSGKARNIPMNSTLRETLRSVPQRIDSPYVFEGTDPGKWLRQALKDAKITNFGWHDLRHTFASRLAMAGVPIRHIAELMGHSQIQVTMRYAHLQPGHLADAVELLAATESGEQTDTPISTRQSTASAKIG